MLHRKRRQLNTLKAADVDYRHGIPRSDNSFAKRMNATLGAEPMLDTLLPESVGGDSCFGREQTQFVYWNSPKKRTLPRTDRAVALRDLGKFAFDLKGNLSAVTATFVFHLWFRSVFTIWQRNAVVSGGY